MNNQLDLFPERVLDPIQIVSHDPDSTLEERFYEFHAANPHVYTVIVKKALALRERGITHFGMKAIFESLRYDAALQTGGDEYRLNNNYTAFYARLIMRNTAVLKDFFETREQSAVESPPDGP